MAKDLTPEKARHILHDKEVHGHPLTDKQRRFFGAMSNKEDGGWLQKYDNGGQLPSIVPTDALKTFDFGITAGTKQTKDKDKAIHKTIIEDPDQPMAGQGESWNDATSRVIPIVKDIINTAPANTTLITHNSVFGLINLWNKQKRPDEFSKEQREKYTKQDGQYKTGDKFTIAGLNGPIHIVRHGQTEDNVKGNFRSDTAELTRQGVQQAKSVGKKLSGIDIPQIITSPLDRTIATSNILAEYQDKKKVETAEDGGWLSKYSDGGNLQEHQPNFNDSHVSIPPNFVGQGHLTTGRNWSPAWGGSWENGGSMPGSVGFSYARTGPTPSEGKYAKKTMPSAENGMSFYQHGLDWKPNNIGQNGLYITPQESTQVVIPKYRQIPNNTERDLQGTLRDEGGTPDTDTRTAYERNADYLNNPFNRERLGESMTGLGKIATPFGEAALGALGIMGAVTAPMAFASSIAAGEATNLGTDYLSKGKYNTWGQMVSDKTGLNNTLAEFTNPGYIVGGGLVEGIPSAINTIKNIPQGYRNIVTAAAKDELHKINPLARTANDMMAYRSITPNRAQGLLEGDPLLKYNMPGKGKNYLPVMDAEGNPSHYIVKTDKELFTARGGEDTQVMTKLNKRNPDGTTTPRWIPTTIADIRTGKFKLNPSEVKIGDKVISTKTFIPQKGKPPIKSLNLHRDLFADILSEHAMQEQRTSGMLSNDVTFRKGAVPKFKTMPGNAPSNVILQADPQHIPMVGAATKGELSHFVPQDIGNFPVGKTAVPEQMLNDRELGMRKGLQMMKIDPVWGLTRMSEAEKASIQATGVYQPERSGLSKAILATDRFLTHPIRSTGEAVGDVIRAANTSITDSMPEPIADVWDIATGKFTKAKQSLVDQVEREHILESELHKAGRIHNDLLYANIYKYRTLLAEQNEKVNPVSSQIARTWEQQDNLRKFQKLEKDNPVSGEGFARPESGGLTIATTTGKGTITDLVTKEQVPAEVNVPGALNRYTLKKNKGAKNKLVSTFDTTGEISINDPYIKTLKKNINEVETIPGTKVYGSAIGVTEGGLPHLTHDIDAFISEDNYKKHVENKFSTYYDPNKPVDTYNVKQHKYANDLPGAKDEGVIDFNIVWKGSDGNAQGKRAEELFKYHDPDAFYAASRKAYETKEPIKIPYTPDELIDKVDPVVKTITDAYESTKDKHINKIDSYISYGNTDKVLEAQKKYLQLLVGKKGTLGHEFDPSHFADESANRTLLREIDFLGDNKVVSENPKRMQIALNDFYINNSVLSRQIDAQTKTTTRRLLDLPEVDAALKIWYPEGPDAGAQAMGAGQNFTRAGNPAHTTNTNSFQGNRQLGLRHVTKDPLSYVDNIKRQTDANYLYTPEEQAGVKEILKKYGISSNQYPNITDPREMIKAAAYHPQAKEALSEVADLTGRKSAGYGNYGNSSYSSPLKDFDAAIEAMEYTLYSKMTIPKSYMVRSNKINSSVYIPDLDIADFHKLKNIMNGAVEKISERLKILDEYRQSMQDTQYERAKVFAGSSKKVLAAKQDLTKAEKLIAEAESQRHYLYDRLARLGRIHHIAKTAGLISTGLGGLVYGASKIPERTSGRKTKYDQEKIRRKLILLNIKNTPPSKAEVPYRDGGVIQDDNGYWNPNNWGHPVEIGSNNITMQGVNQPLLGISDYGDTQLMQPGKNYKFNGKKVREYPIAKDGKELTRLDQLTNFTNYNKPQPGGWLEKYSS